MGAAGATFTIDARTLREVPDDVDAAWAHVRHLESLGAAGDAERVAWLRILGKLEAAEELGWRVVRAADGPGAADALPTDTVPDDALLPPAAIAPVLRLAHVLQWRQRFPDAERLFRWAVHSAERHGSAVSPLLLAAGYQHLGKALFDQHRQTEALAAFHRALELREEAGAPDDLLASTRLAIRTTEQRRNDRV